MTQYEITDFDRESNKIFFDCYSFNESVLKNILNIGLPQNETRLKGSKKILEKDLERIARFESIGCPLPEDLAIKVKEEKEWLAKGGIVIVGGKEVKTVEVEEVVEVEAKEEVEVVEVEEVEAKEEVEVKEEETKPQPTTTAPTIPAMPPKGKGRKVVYDIEADGLLNEVTKVHCIFAIDAVTREEFLFHNHPEFDNVTETDTWLNKDKVTQSQEFTIPKRAGTLEDGARFLNEAEILICHNQIGYDLVALQKFYPWFDCREGDRKRLSDTYIDSKLQNFVRRTPKGAKSPHGLQSWGVRCGVHKPDIKDWTEIDVFKLNRCIEDVRINLQTALALVNERKVKAKMGFNYTKSSTTEHRYSHNCMNQELNGCLVNMEYLKERNYAVKTELEAIAEHFDRLGFYYAKCVGTKITYEDLCKKLKVDQYALAATKCEWEKIGRKMFRSTKEVILEFKLSLRDPKAKNRTTQVPNKMWGSPVMSVTKAGSSYSVKHPELGIEQFGFTTKKAAADYVKSEYPETAVKHWTLVKHDEVVFSAAGARYWDGYTVDAKGTQIQAKDIGIYTPVEFHKIRFTQRAEILSLMLQYGWQPEKYGTIKDKNGRDVKEFAMVDGKKDLVNVKGAPQLSKECKIVFEPLAEGVILNEKEHFIRNVLGYTLMHCNNVQSSSSLLYTPAQGKNKAKGVIANVREDGRIQGGINGYGTDNGRAKHNTLVNLPSSGRYGKVVREAITCEDGRVLVGADMPNCHPRVLSYLAQNELFMSTIKNGKETEYLHFDSDGNLVEVKGANTNTFEVYKGTDYHTVTATLFQFVDADERLKAHEMYLAEVRAHITKHRVLYVTKAKKLAELDKVTQEDIETVEMELGIPAFAKSEELGALIGKLSKGRKLGKGAGFSCLYGKSAKNLARDFDLSLNDAKNRIDSFLDGYGLTPIIEQLRSNWDINANNDCKFTHSIITVQGDYHINCSGKHKLLNALAQGNEAVLQKVSVNWINKEIERRCLDVKVILNMHDEVLFDVAAIDFAEFNELATEFYERGAQILGIDNEFYSAPKEGFTYMECH